MIRRDLGRDNQAPLKGTVLIRGGADQGRWEIVTAAGTREYSKDSKEDCVSFHCCDKLPQKIKQREERLTLAHGFTGFIPWLAGSTAC